MANGGGLNGDVVNDRVVNGDAASIDAVFAGGVVILGDGERSGIAKGARQGLVRIGPEGLEGDDIIDRRVHGGTDKAVLLFGRSGYATLARGLDGARFEPGSFGENLCCSGVDETVACIGDVWRAGTALLQITQPRRPCWKLDARHGIDGLSRRAVETRVSGWYARVIEPGEVGAGQALILEQRHPGACSIKAFWDLVQPERPDPVALEALAAMPGLAAQWRRRLDERARWLRDNAETDAT